MTPRFIDISAPLSAALPAWPDSPGFRRTPLKRIADGDPVNASAISSDVHSGTHVDAPLHFLADGCDVEGLGLIPFVGPVQVVEVPDDVEALTTSVIAPVISSGSTRVLFRTRNSRVPWTAQANFDPSFVGLTLDGAAWLADHGVVLVGNDYLSVQRYGEDDETHRVLLRANVALLEGLDLSRARAGDYTLLCLPLRIPGAEGAPARAVLVEGDWSTP